MAETVLGIVKLDGRRAEPCVFKRACEKARVTFQCESVQSTGEGIQYLNGAGAFRNRKRFPLPALVVVDLELDGGDGWQVLSWIRSQPQFRYLPVVVFSGSKSQYDMKRAYDRGATSYLLKPRNFGAMVEIVKLIERYWLTLNRTPAP